MDNFEDELKKLYKEVGQTMLEEQRQILRSKLQEMVKAFNSAPPEDRRSEEFRRGANDLATVEMFSGEAVQLLLEIEREHRGRALTEKESLRMLSKILQERGVETSNYPEQIFSEAIDSLVGDRSLNQRLESAAVRLSALTEEDFSSEELKEQFRSVVTRLTNVNAISDEGSIRATISQMTEQERNESAKEIHSLYRAVMERDW